MPTLPRIKCGLFQFDTTDYHAILGVPIGSSPEKVRQQYLKITRLLFPDVRKFTSEEEAELADQLLSKLVNPSYEVLFKNQSARKEHLLVLEEIGDRAAQMGNKRLKSKSAKELAQSGTIENIENIYRKYLNSIVKKEYQEIKRALERIALISEFNLVYLMINSGKVPVEQAVETPTSTPSPSTAIQRPIPDNEQEADKEAQEKLPVEEQAAKWVEPYLRRGKQFIDKRDYAKAIMELREALQHDPKNSQAHAYLGLAHVKQGQLGMARVHINKCLQIDPENEMALRGKKVLAKLSEEESSNNAKETSEKNNKENRGLLGGLFGRKKNN